MTAWVLVALLLLPAEALACATCVGAPWQKTDVGFYWSALFLMGVPFAVAGVIGGWLFYHSRRAREPGEKWDWVRFVGTRIARKEGTE